MRLSEELRKVRQRCFLTQESFAKEIGVAYSTVNRWEAGRAKPNLSAMKNIKAFCNKNGIEYANVEDAWLNYDTEGKNGNS